MPTLNLFPARAPIGRFTDSTGKSCDVLMTTEFSRALASLMVRVGGPDGLGTSDILAMAAVAPTDGAAIASLIQENAELRMQVEAAGQLAARLEVLEKALEDMAQLVHGGAQAPTDWEHPGKIGAAAADSASFTTLTTGGKTTLNPGADVEIQPHAPGFLTIHPEQPGQVDNVFLGSTMPRPAKVTTLNGIVIEQPEDSAALHLHNGATLEVPAPGGALGSAAYANANNFATRDGTALGPPAGDPASTQTLANNMRAALLAAGIGV